MANSIKVDDLAAAVVKETAEYSKEGIRRFKVEAKQQAETTTKDIRDRSPVKKGAYKKGWVSKVEHESEDDIRIVIYNKSKGHLTQLLENGHNIAGGKGRAQAFPHVRPAVEKMDKRFAQKIKVIFK